MIRAALAILLFTGAAGAQPDPTYPATECAALWSAMADFRARYAIDAAPPDEAREMAEAFRAAAIGLAGGDAADVDRRINAMRPDLMLLLRSYIIDGWRDSREQFLRRAEICRRFAVENGLPAH
ncbi:hypothetical protein Ga0609869_000375 [Rhodovulum iodosum]|uniref:Uncharacterized protein n=1 Tax=Rhodovulum iodosum TaxID=68291 RepID=A0ABV3XNZ1_9RHOB|nr:hypothetical protein [Rhodovulum robiginosum]RSK37963.1 hypothetical protein EJA01_03290 [Rhodovulum robiginosum]